MNEGVFYFSFITVGVAILIAFFHMVRARHPVDRVVCLDLISLSVAVLISLQAMHSKMEVWLDTVFVLSIIAFISTVLFARYVEGHFERGKSK